MDVVAEKATEAPAVLGAVDVSDRRGQAVEASGSYRSGITPRPSTASARASGPGVEGRLQLTFTWMDRGFASARFGRSTTRMPFFGPRAWIFSASTVPGSAKDRVNVP